MRGRPPSIYRPDNAADNAAVAARQPLSPELLDRMQRYWDAANYLTVGQIYLQDNPLLREPLAAGAHQAAAAGPLGHVARPQLHLRPPEPADPGDRRRRHLHRRPGPRRAGAQRQRLPGRHLHRGPSRGHAGRGGMRRLFRQFSTPGGVPSHVGRTPRTRSTKAASWATRWSTPSARRSTTRT